MKSLGILIAALSLTVGAAQAAERSVTVTVDGQTIQVPIPEGYCPASGAYVERARAVAAHDKDNETVLTLYDCAAMAAGGSNMPRYAHLKFPIALRGSSVTMDEVRGAFPDSASEFAKFMDEAVDEKAIGKEFSEVAQADVKVEVGGLKPAGEDATGVFLAGVMTVQIDGTPVPLATAVGVSSVKGKMLSFNFYAQGDTVQILSRQLSVARGTVRAMGAANP
jgi:hypothetical protein